GQPDKAGKASQVLRQRAFHCLLPLANLRANYSRLDESTARVISAICAGILHYFSARRWRRPPRVMKSSGLMMNRSLAIAALFLGAVAAPARGAGQDRRENR